MEAIEVLCFGEQYVPGMLTRNWDLSDPRTIFLGAYDGPRLVAFNGFIAHPTADGRMIFQSCHSATDPEYRGRGLFTSLLRRAEALLAGDYIVGFPNANSGPIFRAKLDYQFIDLLRVVIPTRLAGLVLSWPAESKTIRFDEDVILAWKQRESAAIHAFRHGDSILWGRIEQRVRAGLTLTMLDAGGIRLTDRADLGSMLKQARQQGVHLVRLVVTPDHPIAHTVRLRLAGDRTEPFIYKALHGQTSPQQFAASTGMKDAWRAD